MSDLLGRAKASRRKFDVYVGQLLSDYDTRRIHRTRRSIPVFAFCGMGRAGKDTSAEYWCSATKTHYPGSSSSIILPIIADSIGIPEAQAWTERHGHRRFWIEWCHAFRHDDPTLLIRMVLGKGDVAVGVRGGIELKTAMDVGIIDYVFWIENARVPVDETVEFKPEDCDLVVLNNGTVAELHARWNKILRLVSRRYFAHIELL